MTNRVFAVCVAILAAGCSSSPDSEVVATGSVDPIVDAGPVVPCGDGGHKETVTFVSYGYYTANGLVKCNNHTYSTPRSVCIYSTSEYQASTVNLCAKLSPAYSCTYSTTTGTDVDYYTTTAYPNIADWQDSCRIIGGKWAVQ